MDNEKKVSFGDLSLPLKASAVGGWLYLALFAFGFVVGFLSALAA